MRWGAIGFGRWAWRQVGLLDNYNTGRGTALFDANGDGLLDVVCAPAARTARTRPPARRG